MKHNKPDSEKPTPTAIAVENIRMAIKNGSQDVCRAIQQICESIGCA